MNRPWRRVVPQRDDSTAKKARKERRNRAEDAELLGMTQHEIGGHEADDGQ